MIYTITANPSLDYHMEFSEPIKIGEYNRAEKESYEAGGKGVNVSIFLNAVNIQSVALGFLGGFVKDYFLSKLKSYPNIQTMFTSIKENSRINVKVTAGKDIRLNAIGPNVSDEEFENFKRRATGIYDTDSIVLSGNVQDSLKDRMIELVRNLAEERTRIVIDTDTDLTEKCLEFNPYMVKLNDSNAGINEVNILKIGKDYTSKGIKHCLYSSPLCDYYYLIDKDLVLKAKKPDGFVSSTGSGDAMIAGWLFSKMRGANTEESFRYAIAFSEKLNLESTNVSINDIDEYTTGIKVDKL